MELVVSRNTVNKKLLSSLVLTPLLMPMIVLAFNPGPVPNTVPGLSINDIIDIIFNILWPIAVAFFIIMFVIVHVELPISQGDPEKIKYARNFVLWGIVGVAVALLA